MPGADVRRLSEALARDPASLAFIPLAELLHARGDRDAALRIARQGAARHALRAEAHDLVARLAAAQERWEEAHAAWQQAAEVAGAGSALRARALQGRAFVAFREARFADAERFLDEAAAAGASESAVAAARARVRARLGDPDGRHLFDSLLEDGDHTAMLVSEAGEVTAGRCVGDGGRDATAEVARALAGVGEQADRAMVHLALGAWQTITIEAEGAMVAVAPAGRGVALVAIHRGTPLGRLRRLLERVMDRARAWRGTTGVAA